MGLPSETAGAGAPAAAAAPGLELAMGTGLPRATDWGTFGGAEERGMRHWSSCPRAPVTSNPSDRATLLIHNFLISTVLPDLWVASASRCYGWRAGGPWSDAKQPDPGSLDPPSSSVSTFLTPPTYVFLPTCFLLFHLRSAHHALSASSSQIPLLSSVSTFLSPDDLCDR